VPVLAAAELERMAFGRNGNRCGEQFPGARQELRRRGVHTLVVGPQGVPEVAELHGAQHQSVWIVHHVTPLQPAAVDLSRRRHQQAIDPDSPLLACTGRRFDRLRAVLDVLVILLSCTVTSIPQAARQYLQKVCTETRAHRGVVCTNRSRQTCVIDQYSPCRASSSA